MGIGTVLSHVFVPWEFEDGTSILTISVVYEYYPSP